MSKWISTEFKGVRYRKHKTRKHGVKFDRYFSIRFQRDGKRPEEGLGWSSEGWTTEKAALQLAELREGYRTGKSDITLAEKREKMKRKREKETKDQITVGEYFTETYFPQAQFDKAQKSCERERGLFDNYIKPVIGKLPFRDIAPIHIEKIKKNMADAENSPRSIEYALAVIRQIFNTANHHNVFNGDNQANKVKKPKVDNKRDRFLTHGEAKDLLDNLHIRSRSLWEMSLISLHCGLRAGELFKLRWIDIGNELIKVQGKGTKTRFVPMTKTVKNMLLDKDIGKPESLIFPARDGGIRKKVSRAYPRAVKDLGFNDGIEDRLNKVVFHTQRHTFASWLVQNGEDLYVVKELMGHSTIAMTERYAHLAPKNIESSVHKIEAIWSEPETDKVIDITERTTD